LNKPFKRASFLYWASIPVLLLYGILYPDKVLALNAHDTVYVIANLHLQILLVSNLVKTMHFSAFRFSF